MNEFVAKIHLSLDEEETLYSKKETEIRLPEEIEISEGFEGIIKLSPIFKRDNLEIKSPVNGLVRYIVITNNSDRDNWIMDKMEFAELLIVPKKK